MSVQPADIFISHASEDKEEIARPLAEALRQRGLIVWYDDYVLRLGDSLREVIDRGLSSSRFGVVILSTAFFSKEWPQRELNGLLARETTHGTKVLLPVWHRVTAEEVARFSPLLVDKLSVSTALGLDVVVLKILEVIEQGRKIPELQPASSPRREPSLPMGGQTKASEATPKRAPDKAPTKATPPLPQSSPPATLCRPTVLLGLGGTGHDLLLQVKKRLIERFGKVPPCISLLSIDTTEPDRSVLQTSDGRAVELDPVAERFVIQTKNWKYHVYSANEHIAQWWPPNTADSAMTAGATQIRPRGRLAFFAKYADIIRMLKKIASRVTNDLNLDKLDDLGIRLSDRLGVDVYILSSLAGGTGSGMLLDVAFNIRRHYDFTTSITGVLVLPRVFNQYPGIRQNSNTYATLKEIEFFTKIRPGQSFTIDYGGDNSVTVMRPPFDTTFLVDSINEQGSLVPRDDLFSIVGEGVYLLMASRFDTEISNDLDNIEGTLRARGPIRARSVAYCSFGVAALTINQAAEAKGALVSALGLVEQLLDYYQAGEAEEAPIDFVPHAVIDNLLSSAQRLQGSPIDVSLSVLAVPKERGRILSDLKARYDRRRREIEGSVAIAVHDAEATALAEVNRRGREWWLGRTGSLGGWGKIARRAPASIEDLDFRINVLKQEAAEKGRMLGQLRGKGEGVRSQIEQATEPKRYLFQGRLFTIGGLIRRMSYLFSGELTAYCELEARRAAIRLLEAAKESLREYERSAREVISKLEVAKYSLMSHGAEMGHEETRNLFEYTIHPSKQTVEVSLSMFIEWFNGQYGSFEALKSRSSEEITQLIYSFVVDGRTRRQNGTIEAALTKGGEEATKLILNRFFDLASPLWSLDESEIPLTYDTILEISCYGVFDAEKYPLKELHESGLESRSVPRFASLFQHDRITLFRVKAGVPLFALGGLEELEKAYYQQTHRATCHADARWQSFPDLIPARNKAMFHEVRSMNLLWFVVALASSPFGIFVEEGGFYFSQAEKPAEPRTLLGDSFSSAFSKFSKSKRLVKRVEKKVREAINVTPEWEVREALETQLTLLREGRMGRWKGFEETGLLETAILMLDEFMEKPSSFPRIE